VTRLLRHRGGTLTLGDRTLVMGIVNVTPDSFSDGGLHLDPNDAVAGALRMAEEGADILDIGGESTRPGHTPISADEEWARVRPVLEGLASSGRPLPPISIDTTKPEVARKAVERGASIVNDIWGFQRNPDLANLAAAYGAAAVLMHNRDLLDGTIDIVEDMLRFFDRSVRRARKAGLADDRIVIDPGIGFGKTLEQNLQAVMAVAKLRTLGFPILLGVSRKSFIARLFDPQPSLAERLAGSIAANTIGVLAGADIVRVHDVAPHVQAMRVADALRRAT
jgi:dihydropteroate synthase